MTVEGKIGEGIGPMGGWTAADHRSLAILFSAGTACSQPDAELLDRFLAGGAEQAELAFESLLLRHGPMVLAVCERTLGNRHDAEDAFQATFLILATRARSIMKHRSLASWLHGVALKVARRARAKALRTKEEQRRFAEMMHDGDLPEACAEPSDVDDEALHREVQRLPRKYREAIVLCSLQGLTQEAAAGMLHCPPSTVAVRLMRARQRLKAKLSRRAMAEAEDKRVAELPAKFALPVLPAGLISSTLRQAARVGARGLVPIAASGLASEVLRSMVMVHRVKLGTLALAATVAMTSAGGILAHGRAGAKPWPAQQAKEHKQAPPLRIGDKVVVKYPTPLERGDRVVDHDELCRIYLVEELKDARVRLSGYKVSGWVPLNAVIPLDQAVSFYTAEIKAHPDNAEAYLRELSSGRKTNNRTTRLPT